MLQDLCVHVCIWVRQLWNTMMCCIYIVYVQVVIYAAMMSLRQTAAWCDCVLSIQNIQGQSQSQLHLLVCTSSCQLKQTIQCLHHAARKSLIVAIEQRYTDNLILSTLYSEKHAILAPFVEIFIQQWLPFPLAIHIHLSNSPMLLCS